MADLGDLRAKLVYHTSSMNLFLNMVSMGSVGRVEKKMDEAGGDLKEIKLAVNGITAHLITKGRHEGSVLTAYADDDRAVWKEFRRELLSDGFSSAVLRRHKATIKAYVTELGERGLLDEEDPHEVNETSEELAAPSDTDSIRNTPEILPATTESNNWVRSSAVDEKSFDEVSIMDSEIEGEIADSTASGKIIREISPRSLPGTAPSSTDAIYPHDGSITDIGFSTASRTASYQPYAETVVESDHDPCGSGPINCGGMGQNVGVAASSAEAASLTYKEPQNLKAQNTYGVKFQGKRSLDDDYEIKSKEETNNTYLQRQPAAPSPSPLSVSKGRFIDLDGDGSTSESSCFRDPHWESTQRVEARHNTISSRSLDNQESEEVSDLSKGAETGTRRPLAAEQGAHAQQRNELSTVHLDELPLAENILFANLSPFQRENPALATSICGLKEDNAKFIIDTNGKITGNKSAVASFGIIDRDYHSRYELQCRELFKTSATQLRSSQISFITECAAYEKLGRHISSGVLEKLDNLNVGDHKKVRASAEFLIGDAKFMLYLLHQCVNKRSAFEVVRALWHAYHGRLAPLCVDRLLSRGYFPDSNSKTKALRSLNLKLQMVNGMLDTIKYSSDRKLKSQCCVLQDDVESMMRALYSFGLEHWEWSDVRADNQAGRKIVVWEDESEHLVVFFTGSRCTCCPRYSEGYAVRQAELGPRSHVHRHDTMEKPPFLLAYENGSSSDEASQRGFAQKSRDRARRSDTIPSKASTPNHFEPLSETPSSSDNDQDHFGKCQRPSSTRPFVEPKRSNMERARNLPSSGVQRESPQMFHAGSQGEYSKRESAERVGTFHPRAVKPKPMRKKKPNFDFVDPPASRPSANPDSPRSRSSSAVPFETRLPVYHHVPEVNAAPPPDPQASKSFFRSLRNRPQPSPTMRFKL